MIDRSIGKDRTTHRLALLRWTGIFYAVCLVLCTISRGLTAEETAKRFRAGAATSNITPPLGELVVGGFVPVPARTVHDELHARCLVLDDGTTQLAFVICDNVGISQHVYDAARKFIDAETDLPSERVLMAATHTHSATAACPLIKIQQPESLTAYEAFLARRIGDVVRLALSRLEPARIGWGQVDEISPLNNRRWIVSNPELARTPFGDTAQVRMNPPPGDPGLVRPAGPVDPGISFLSVQSRDGRPLALLANYSLHYVGGVPAAEISADYFAVFAEQIAQRLAAGDPNFVGILTNGTSGDVNNINFREREPRRQPYEKMREVATLIADRVITAQTAITYQDWVPLQSTRQDLTLAVRLPTQQQLQHFQAILEKPEDAPRYHPQERVYADRILKLADAHSEITVPLQAIRIGDLGITAIPFEVFAEMGLEIKDRSPFGSQFNMELANGSYGYLPTAAQHQLGGYETWLGTNYVEPEAATKITASLLEMLESLQAAPQP